MRFVKKKKWFLKKFSKRSRKIELGYRNLYIFPNKFGFYWIFAAVLIYIYGTNLDINLTTIISYLMFAILIINLFLTHYNLHGLEIYSIPQEVSFAGNSIKYKIILNSRKIKNNINLKFIADENDPITIKNIEGKNSYFIQTSFKKRGIFYPEIVYGESSAPMSLFSSWFYWRPKDEVIVSPRLKPNACKSIKNYLIKASVSGNNFGDDISNLKNYRKGEKKSSIDWKAYARTNKLSSKEFTDSITKIKSLKLRVDIPLEEALEYLCFEINEEYKNGKVYEVKMTNNLVINAGCGYDHYRKCMILLARYLK